MFRIGLCVAVLTVWVAGVAEVAGGRSPNAALVEKLLKTPEGSRFSTNVIEDALLDVPGLVQKYGYPFQAHDVTTADGYILQAHRIPFGRVNNIPGLQRPVVFLMHGLFSSSADYLVLGPENALGYLLAEEGYDVWLGNARGNYYSRRHISLDPDDTDFWRFSWEEIGHFDLAAYVDYILAITGQSRLHYIGHSQGGTSFLVLNSLRPQYNDRFISFQGLAPAAYFDNNESAAFALLAPYEKIIDTIAFQLGIAELLPNGPFLTWVGTYICGPESVYQSLCINAINANGNFDYFNATMVPVFLGHAPAGASIRQVAHYGQTIRRNAFARFYHDPITNLRLYGRITPPEFDMSLITAPAYLYYGKADTEADWRDIINLGARLGNTVGVYGAERESFNHYDFIWGGRVKEELYLTLFRLLREAEMV